MKRLALLSILAIACTSAPASSPPSAPASSPPTIPTPPATPTATPTTTPSVTPPAAPTATPTTTLPATPPAAPPATPTPSSSAATILGIDTIVTDNPSPITRAQLKALIEDVYKGSQYLADTLAVADKCARGATPADPEGLDSLSDCYVAIVATYGTDYLSTGDMGFYQVAQGFYDLALATHPASVVKTENLQNFNQDLLTRFPAPRHS